MCFTRLNGSKIKVSIITREKLDRKENWLLISRLLMGSKTRNTVESCMSLIDLILLSGIEQEENQQEEAPSFVESQHQEEEDYLASLQHDQTLDIPQHSTFSHPPIQFDASSIHVNLLDESIIESQINTSTPKTFAAASVPSPKPTEMEAYLLKKLDALELLFDGRDNQRRGVEKGTQTFYRGCDAGVQVVCLPVNICSVKK
jgi:hypothetical protein